MLHLIASDVLLLCQQVLNGNERIHRRCIVITYCMTSMFTPWIIKKDLCASVLNWQILTNMKLFLPSSHS